MTSSVPLFWTQETSVWLNLRVYTHTDTKRDLRDVLSPFLVPMYLLMYTSNHSCETSVRASVARLYTHVTTFTYGFSCRLPLFSRILTVTAAAVVCSFIASQSLACHDMLMRTPL